LMDGTIIRIGPRGKVHVERVRDWIWMGVSKKHRTFVDARNTVAGRVEVSVSVDVELMRCRRRCVSASEGHDN